MRVSNESTKGIEQSRDSKKPARTGEASEAKEGSGRKSRKIAKSDAMESSDKVQLSSKGRDVAKAKAAAMAAPDVNEEKVERLRNSIQSGTYKVDAEQVADRLVDDHLSNMY